MIEIKEIDLTNIKDKIILITGGNSGIGYQMANLFASKGAQVVIASRNTLRSLEAVEKIKKNFPNAKISCSDLDLSSKKSICSFVEFFNSKYKKMDILINNAALMYKPYSLSNDGYEMQMAVNHLGHFLLTKKLFNKILNSKDARIINVSSIAHKYADIDFEDFFFKNEKNFSKSRAYNRSKLANLLFSTALKNMVDKEGLNIKIFSAHPGISRTGLFQFMKKNMYYNVLKLVSQNSFKGCLPVVLAATNQNYESGTYFGPGGLFEIKGKPSVVKMTKKAQSKSNAYKLWSLSEDAIGEKFTIIK